MRKRRTTLLVGVAAVATTALVSAAALAAIANVKPYAVGIAGGYTTKRLISAGDTVAETSNRGKQFKLVGIPDGLGAHRNPNGTKTLYLNHELTGTALSEPVVGDPSNRGAFVSKLILDRAGNVVSGERAYDVVYEENEFVGPAAAVGNNTRPLSRFCSGFLAGPAEGFDRPIYFTNEEEGTPAGTFDGRGGVSVAIVDNKLHTLPKLGHFARENTLVQPTRGKRTVIIGMEDGPATLDPEVENSQLYMYVGKKQRRKGASVLRRNGLDNGKLYVLVPSDSPSASEADFTRGSLDVEWTLIPDAEEMDEAELEAASDEVGAIRFARPEDGAFNNLNPDEFFFVTTGGATGVNELGRLYSLKLSTEKPWEGGRLSVVYNADTVIAAGGDIAISPDNIDVSNRHLMINEDGTAETRAVMAAKGRDGSIWRFDLYEEGVDRSSALRVARLDPPGRDGIPVGPGIWETSGIIDASGLLGGDTWLFDVQAHPPTTAPAPGTVEDGQLLLLTRNAAG